MRPWPLLACGALAALLAAACGGSQILQHPDGSAGGDAAADGASPPSDARPDDGGAPPDDGAPGDAGAPPDDGAPGDAGAPPDDGGASDGGLLTWRPFSADSPWNTPIPANPELEPDSVALITDFTNSSPYGVHLDVNIAGYSIPLYPADGTTPTYQVLADVGGDGWTGTNGMNATGTMPIPAGAQPDPQSDHHLAVVDRQAHMEWACWNLRFEAGQWHGGLCATSDLAGTGVRPNATTADPWWTAHGARACGFPLVAGLIRTEEIQAGRIDHALVVAYPHIRAGWFQPPASTAQGRVGDDAISTRGIPCGGRIQYDPSVDLDTLGLSASGKVIVRALQVYGAYVGDYSGAISLYAENSAAAQAIWSAGVLDSYELQDKIDFSRFRVIKLGTLYDNGNGG
jgi:hypothetical protein